MHLFEYVLLFPVQNADIVPEKLFCDSYFQDWIAIEQAVVLLYISYWEFDSIGAGCREALIALEDEIIFD